MKLMTFLLLVGVLSSFSANSYSQGALISIELEKHSIKEVLGTIEKKSDYAFFFSEEISSELERKVNVHVKQTTLDKILDEILQYTGLTYRISDRQVTLTKVNKIKEVLQNPKIRVQGKIIDQLNEPLIGVTIKVHSSNTGTITDVEGNYSLEVDKDAVLEISYIGHLSQKIKVNDRNTINIQMTEDTQQMDDVVVIAYGTVKRRDLTGSVSTVKTEDIKDIPVARVDQMLQGRIAGAEIMSTSGEPGAGTSIRIRGTRSISATNEPLYVVDGVMDAVTDLNDLNPSDIQSIEVLKDASSTAIYGARGSNGVILISTKSGGEGGKTVYTFRTDVGFSQMPRYLDLMNATEFAILQNDRYYHASSNNQTKPLEEYPTGNYYPDPLSLGEGTDWTKAITRNAPYQNYFISASGGDKVSKFYFSGNYNNTEGIIKASGMKRYQGRLNYDRTLSKYVKAGLRVNYAYIDQEVNTADVGSNSLWYRSTLFLSPTMSLYKEDGSYNDWNTQWYSGTLFDSPLVYVDMYTKDVIRKSLSTMLYLEAEPIKDLKLKSYISFYDYARYEDNFAPSSMPSRESKSTGAYAYKRSYKDNNILSESTLFYKKTFNKKHNFDALYGFTMQKFWDRNMAMSGDGYFIDAIKTNDMAALPSKETISIASGATEKLSYSNLARFNYNYDSKYYLTVSARADASSNFASGHKWGYFPSAALKWNIARESFLKDNKVISELSIRLSGGIAGNDAIPRYRSLAALSSTSGGYIFGGAIPVSYYPSRIADESLTWEKTTSYNAGLDISLWNNRITASLEAYTAYTKDLLLTVQLPSHTGYTSRLTNIGETSNKGLELTINSRNITTEKFSWSTTLTMAHNKQMVEDIGGLARVSAYNNPHGAQYIMYGYEKGRPLNALWGMKYAGVWKNQQEIEENKYTKRYASSVAAYYSPGRQRYIDQNNDGILDNKDIVYLGNADPILYGGLQNSFKLYGFSLNVYFNYSIGGKIYNPVELFMGTGTYLSNQFKYMVNAWHPIRNPDSDYPRADSKDDIPNDRFVHNASFLRLKDVSVSYTFDLAKKTNNILKTLTLTASGNNIYLWKHYNGYDPEVSTQSGGSTIRRMDNGAYPNSRTFTFSTLLNF
ncbi:MAG: TonB-dependent receptor [Dysgonomonas sp.]|nr:TonB-dependent receptor [Dysgonomonas sp.]